MLQFACGLSDRSGTQGPEATGFSRWRIHDVNTCLGCFTFECNSTPGNTAVYQNPKGGCCQLATVWPSRLNSTEPLPMPGYE